MNEFLGCVSSGKSKQVGDAAKFLQKMKQTLSEEGEMPKLGKSRQIGGDRKS